MNIKVVLGLLTSHAVVGILGFALGIYMLPILIAPPAPTDNEIATLIEQAEYSAEFTKNLKGSDNLHWGEGKVSITQTVVTLNGQLAPGPDYKLYFSPQFVETEAAFNQLKPSMRQVGEVKTFENFVVSLPADMDLTHYNSVVIWCETFGEFITAAKYR